MVAYTYKGFNVEIADDNRSFDVFTLDDQDFRDHFTCGACQDPIYTEESVNRRIDDLIERN